jgi:serine/threonine protein kinase
MYLDIKASNCVLSEKGHIKLCDFGCSKVLYPAAEYTSVVRSEPTSGPRTRTFLGSHHIMPVEMLQGRGYGVSVDWWALGVLLFEMITGTPPFDNEQHLVQGKVF